MNFRFLRLRAFHRLGWEGRRDMSPHNNYSCPVLIKLLSNQRPCATKAALLMREDPSASACTSRRQTRLERLCSKGMVVSVKER